MNKSKVGKLFTTDGKDAWILVSYCEYPTATLKKLLDNNKESDTIITGVIDSNQISRFIELIPEKEIPKLRRQ